MNDSATTATAEKAAEQQPHPTWCDPHLCTWSENGGAHHSVWVSLGPLPRTNQVVHTYLYATGVHDEPLAMISFLAPVDHPDDIADNAGMDEDTTAHVVLPLNQVLQLTGLLTMLVATAKGTATPQANASSPR